MMSFTKILWAGSKHILITESELSNKVLALLDFNDIQRLNSEWGEYVEKQTLIRLTNQTRKEELFDQKQKIREWVKENCYDVFGRLGDNKFMKEFDEMK